MSNVVAQKVVYAGGAGQVQLSLSGPAAYGVAGGPNLATLASTAGDVRVSSLGGGGLAVQAGTGNVGVGQTNPAFALDVSGAARATYFVDPSGNRLLANAAALWSQGTVAFQRDDGTSLSVGAGGSLSCRYFWFGAMVTAEIKMVLGAGANLGVSSQGWCWTLPVAPAATSMAANVGSALLLGGAPPGVAYVGVAFATGSGTVKVHLDALSTVGVTLDVPFAWAAGDSVSLLLTYEASGVQQPAYVVPVGLTQSATAGCNCLGLGLAPGALAPVGSFVVAGAVGVGGLATPGVALDVSGGIRASGAVTGATGTFAQLNASNVAILGALETVNAYETHSSNVVIANLGTGPALVVSQVETGPWGAQPVASFVAGSNVALTITSTGALAVGKATAAYALDISGTLAASNVTVLGALAVGQSGVTAGYAMDVSGVCRATAFQLSGGGAVGAGGGWASSTASNLFSGAGSNVGIGKVPGQNFALDVSGNVSVSGLTTHGSNVGVGKAPTGFALDVSGSVNVGGVLNVSSFVQSSNLAFMYSGPVSNYGAGTDGLYYPNNTYSIGGATGFTSVLGANGAGYGLFTAPISGVYLLSGTYNDTATNQSNACTLTVVSTYGNYTLYFSNGAASHTPWNAVVRLQVGGTAKLQGSSSLYADPNDVFMVVLLFSC